jgi:hypothetical protein
MQVVAEGQKMKN